MYLKHENKMSPILFVAMKVTIVNLVALDTFYHRLILQ